MNRAIELDIDPRLAVSFFGQESNNNWNSPTSDRGAGGGMQVIPGTYKRMMGTSAGSDNAWNNMEAGLRYIRYGQDTLKTRDPELLAAGYHAGYDHPSLKKGVIPDTDDGHIKTADYARQVAARMRGEAIPKAGGVKKASVTDGFEPVTDPATLKQYGIAIPGVPDGFEPVGKEEADAFTQGMAKQQQAIDDQPVLDYFKNKGVQGWDDMRQSLGTAKWALGGTDDTSFAESLSKKMTEAGARPKTTDEKLNDADFKEVSDAKGVKDTTVASAKAIYGALSRPKATVGEIIQQASNSVPTIVSGTVGAGGGAIAGSPGGVPGMVAGSIWGGKAGMAVGTTAIEGAGQVEEFIGKKLAEQNIPPTAQNILAVISQPGFKQEALKQGALKGLTIAAIDQLTLGLGGKIVSAPAKKIAIGELEQAGVDVSTAAARKAALATPAGRAAVEAAKPTLGAKVGAGAKAAGLDAAGEVAGDYAGSVAATGQGDFGDSLRGGVMSIGQSAASPVVAGAIESGKAVINAGQGGTAPVAAAPAPITPTPNAPSTAAGPLQRATENAAVKPDRVTVTTPEGQVTGAVVGTSTDGVVQVADDNGEVFNFKIGENGISITPEVDNTPLTNAREAAALSIDKDQPAPVEPVAAQSEQPAAPAEPAPSRAAVKKMVDEQNANITRMSDEELRDNLNYIVNQAKTNNGWSPMLIKARGRVEDEIASRQAPPSDPEAIVPPAPTKSAVTETAPVKLPVWLAGAKPRYAFGDKQFELKFASDIDRAAYIAAQDKPSKRDGEYVAFVAKHTGMSEAEIRAHGKVVRDTIKAQAKGADAGVLNVSEVKRAANPVSTITKIGADENLQATKSEPAPVEPAAANPIEASAPAEAAAAGRQSSAESAGDNAGAADKPAALKPKTVSKEDADHLFGVDKKRATALKRIAGGTAYFGDKAKAQEFITKNGLKDTHEVVQTSKVRFEVKAKGAENGSNERAGEQPASAKEVVEKADGNEATAAAVQSDAQAAEGEVTKSDQRKPTAQEIALSKDAPHELDLNKKQTGWKAVPIANGDGTVLVSTDGKKAITFATKDAKSGTEGMRARAKAQAYAIDNPYSETAAATAEQTLEQQVQDFIDGKRDTPPDVPKAAAQEDDLAAMFDDVLAEEMAKDAKKTKQQSGRTAGEATKSAAKNSAEALSNAIDGLGKLFGSNNRLGSGLSFDEESYAKAKPLFIEAIKNLKDAGSDIREAMRVIVRMVLDKFGPDAATNMKPYVLKFAQDVQSGEIAIQDADEAQAEARNAEAQDSQALMKHFSDELAKGNMPKDNPALKKMIASFDGSEPSQPRMKQAQEALEAAIVVESRRQIALKPEATDSEMFKTLVDLYNAQPNLNIRTSTSVDNQAYSTPAPLAYLAGRLAGINETTLVYEPTAGNGMLLITADPAKATANELDTQRFENLKAQGIDAIQGDALTLVDSGAITEKSQDAVITNPPFGSIKDQDGKATKVQVDGYKLGKIDHLIAADALRTMKDDGKAVLIIGADKVAGGLSTDDRIFFNWLYSHYNVSSHFEMDGKLYARQGAGWPVRIISINGRVASNAVSPKPGTVKRVNTWEQVYAEYEQGLVSQNEGIERGAEGGPVSTGKTNVSDGAQGSDGSQAGQTDQGGPAGGTAPRNVRGARTGAVSDQAAGSKKPVGERAGKQRRDGKPAGQGQLAIGTEADGATSPEAGGNQPSGAPGTARVNALSDADNAFQTKYTPASSRKDEGVLIPVNMKQPLADAMAGLEDKVGDIDEFARKELGYKSVADLHNALMGLQVDSVAMAINNMKDGNKGTIIADQTGIGKGRQAAAIIRWAAKNGKVPVFITVKPSLFTDMYNDLADIGTNDVAPLIINGDEAISGEGSTKLFANRPSHHKDTLRSIATSGTLPEGRNAVFLTYSQINTENVQRQALLSLAGNAVFVLDESHNAGGQSSTGEYVTGLLETASGVVYLSATYAKRPDNMPVYFKTDIGEAVADSDTLSEAMARGGLPLQTVVSNNLVKAGQMFRRERSYDGVSIATKNDTPNAEAHEKLSDGVTSALRGIVEADSTFHDVYFTQIAKELAEDGKQAYDNAGNKASESVNHTEFSSVVHNFVRQLLLGLKADTAANEAIAAIKRGEKPLIALDNTMGSFLNEYASSLGIAVGQPLGDFDYRNVLTRALDRSRYISEDDGRGNKVKKYVPLDKLDPITRAAYSRAQAIIDDLDVSSIPVSPIDWIRSRIEKAGYSVAEITGRDLAVDYSGAVPKLTKVPTQEQNDKVGTTRAFNAGQTDVVILNVSGSTGISLHSSEKFADQRPRHMIIAQAAQDINIFMQMLGRIHRTGQVNLPSYTILNVDLPAEKRPTAILSGKMKSLNANTSSNTESATSVQSLDMLNKYGDQVIASYLMDDRDLASALGIEDFADSEGKPTEDLARKVTGKLALMPVEKQRQFYAEVEEQYAALINYLDKTNQNDLAPRTFDFDAKEMKKETLVEQEGDSPFQAAAEYVEYSIKAQGKPMSFEEIKAEAIENLGGKTPAEVADGILANLEGAYPIFVEALTTDTMKAAADITKDKATRFIKDQRIGTLWRVEINGEIYNAAIINVKNSHKGTGNPYSLSKTTVTLAVNGSLRQVSVPATQFEKIVVSKLGTNIPMEELFQTPAEGEREQAKVITGNLLAAYGELKGGGTIINFTKEDGTIEQGILLPKKFDYGRDTAGDYRFRTAADAVKFLMKGQSEALDKLGIQSRDGVVRVVRDGAGIEIRVPKSKLRGGKYFSDAGIRAVTGDFTSSGASMVATVPGSKAVQAIEALNRKTSLYALPSMAEDARAVVGDKAAEAKPVADTKPAFSRGKQSLTPEIGDDDQIGGKAAFFDDDGNAYIQYGQDKKGNIRLQSMESSDKVRGREMVQWLANEYGRKIIVDEVAPTAVGFWEKMKSEGLIESWNRKAYTTPFVEVQAQTKTTKTNVDSLETIFAGLEGKKMTKRQALDKAAAHPAADAIKYIEANWFDIMGEIEDSGKVDIKC